MWKITYQIHLMKSQRDKNEETKRLYYPWSTVESIVFYLVLLHQLADLSFLTWLTYTALFPLSAHYFCFVWLFTLFLLCFTRLFFFRVERTYSLFCSQLTWPLYTSNNICFFSFYIIFSSRLLFYLFMKWI